MQVVWHGEMQLITDLDRVFEQGNSDQIDIVKAEVKQYEKDIRERGIKVVNQNEQKPRKRKQRPRKSRMTEKGLARLSVISQASFSFG